MFIRKTLSTLLGLFLLTSAAAAQTSILPLYPPQSVAQYFKYNRINTTATTVVKGNAGLLHTLCINTTAATETLTIYDNSAASGIVIGVITLTATSSGCYTYDVIFTTGLTIVSATAAGDITVSYL